MTIDNLQVAVADATTEINTKYPAFELFDQRQGHSVRYDNCSLAVCFLAANTRLLSNKGSSGIHRAVSIAVIDAGSKKPLVSQTVWITMSKVTTSKQMRFDLPICADEINFDNGYEVIATDVITRVPLAHKIVAFYDERDYNNPIASDWVVTGASVSPHYSTRRYRAIRADALVCNKVRFDLARFNKCHVTDYPEMEIRIFFPDGSVKHSFCNVGTDDFDAYDAGKYYAEMRFAVSNESMGVCYADILCLGQTINGFVFSTDDDSKEGVWAEEHLGIMDSHYVQDYALRYAQLKQASAESDANRVVSTRDYFEEALERFISSQLTEDSDDPQVCGNQDSVVDNDNGSDESNACPDRKQAIGYDC